jgi:hypothetical protein
MLERELERLLTARGWARSDDEDDLEWFRPLADGLEIGLDVFEDDDGTIAADIDVHHLRAQRWLHAGGERISAYLTSELAEAAGREEPLAWASPDLVACAAEIAALADDAVARLTVRAGTRDAYLAALGEDPERAPHLDAIAAALDAEGEPPGREPLPPPPTFRESYARTRERDAARRAALAAVEAQDLPDADARARALAAELAARGVEEDPLWIRRHAEDEPTRPTWRGLAGDVRRLARRFNDGELGGDLGAFPAAGGAWREVALDPRTDPETLRAAFAGADLRIGDTATVAGQLTPDGAVVLGDAVIGRVDGVVLDAVIPTVLQLGRVGAGERLFVQVRVPE